MSKKDHTVGESLRYWKDRDYENMTLSTIKKFEQAFREYDKMAENKEQQELENFYKPKWDFEGERLEFLRTGILPNVK